MAKPLSLYPPQISEWDPATAIPTNLRSSDNPAGMIGMERNSGRFSSLATICRPDNTDGGNCKLDVGAPTGSSRMTTWEGRWIAVTDADWWASPDSRPARSARMPRSCSMRENSAAWVAPQLPPMLTTLICAIGVCSSHSSVCAASRWYIRSEEHTSELQSLMRSTYAVFCLENTKTLHYRYNNLYKINT